MKRRGRGPITTSSKAARPSPFPGRDFLNMEMKHAATIFNVVEDLARVRVQLRLPGQFLLGKKAAGSRGSVPFVLQQLRQRIPRRGKLPQANLSH